jgi:hypothetical protein
MNYPDYDKTIYITYKNVEKLENIKQQWLELNPGYNVELYDDSRCLKFLDSYYGKKYCDIFNYIKDGPIKSDFFRVCILYIFGGIYVDADVKPLIPIDEYIDHDVDFATCISYNYKRYLSGIYDYNPHFIVTKKNNIYLHNTIKKYESLYDRMTPYSYWKWSICVLFNIDDLDIEITLQKNTFIFNGKKYQFLIEKIENDNILYDFTNIRDENNKSKVEYISKCFCTFNNVNVIENFKNKHLLV